MWGVLDFVVSVVELRQFLWLPHLWSMFSGVAQLTEGVLGGSMGAESRDMTTRFKGTVHRAPNGCSSPQAIGRNGSFQKSVIA